MMRADDPDVQALVERAARARLAFEAADARHGAAVVAARRRALAGGMCERWVDALIEATRDALVMAEKGSQRDDGGGNDGG